MRRALATLVLALAAAACTGPGSISEGAAGSAIGGRGASGSSGASNPNASLEGDPALTFVPGPGSEGQSLGSPYSDGGWGQLLINIDQDGCGETPPWLLISVGTEGGAALVPGNYPVGDGGIYRPPVDAGAAITLYTTDTTLPAVDGFLFFNAIGSNGTIGNFSVDLALPDGGTSNLAGTFDVGVCGVQ